MKSKRNILLAVLVLALLATACGTAVPDKTSKQMPTKVEAQAAAQESAPVVAPTQKPAAPEPSYSENEEVVTYLNTVADSLDIEADVMTDLATLWGMAGENPILIVDSDWLAAYRMTESNAYRWVDLIRSLDPPVKMRGVHGELLQVADNLELALQYDRKAIDNIDPDALDKGNGYLEKATNHMNAAIEELDKVD